MGGSDLLCQRDYSAACPSGWSELASGKCEPPKNGRPAGCPGATSFRGLGPLAKSALAKKCGGAFACKSSSTMDSFLEAVSGGNVEWPSETVINIQMESQSPERGDTDAADEKAHLASLHEAQERELSYYSEIIAHQM